MIYKRNRRAIEGCDVQTIVCGKGNWKVAKISEESSSCCVFVVEDQRAIREMDDVDLLPTSKRLGIQVYKERTERVLRCLCPAVRIQR